MNTASILFDLGYIFTGGNFSIDVGDRREEDLDI